MTAPFATTPEKSVELQGDEWQPVPVTRRWRSGNLTLAGLIVAMTVALAHFTWSGFFVYDDYIYLGQAQREGLSLKLLGQPLNLHFSPGHRAADWALQRWFPLNFDVAQLLLLCLFALSLLLLHQVLVELFGRGPGPVVLTVLYGTSIVHVGIVQWWASALQSLPSTVLSLASILAYLCYRRTHRRALLVASAAAVVIGLAFYIKPLLVPLYLVLLRLLVLDPQRSVRESLGDIIREWRDWLLYLVPAALYAVGYFAWYWEPSGNSAPGLLGQFLRVSWGRVVLPSFVGFEVSRGHTSAAMGAAILAVEIGLAVTVVWTVARRPRAWRAWAFLVVGFLVNATAVGLARLGAFGTLVAYGYRYWLEVTYLLPIALGAAFLGFPERDSVGEWLRRAGRGGWHKAVIALGILALCAHLVLAWSSAGRMSSAWPGRQASAYVHTLSTGLHHLADEGVHPTVLDGVVPEAIMPSWMGYGSAVQYNRHSEFLRLIDPTLQFDRPSRSLFVVRDDGSLVPVTFVPEDGGGAVGLVRTGALVVTSGTVASTQQEVCVASGPMGGSVQLSPAAPLSGKDGYVGMTYSSDVKAKMTLFVDRGRGYTYLDQRTIEITKPGPGSTLTALGDPPVRRIRVDLPAKSHVCLRDLTLGRVITNGASPGALASGRSGSLDPFDRDDSTSALGSMPAGPSWQAASGTWGIAGGEAFVSHPAPGDGPDLAVVRPPVADGTVQVRMARGARQAGLIFRYRNPSDYWALVAAPDYATWVVVRIAGGEQTVVANSGVASTGDGTTIGVRLRGGDVDVMIDGKVTTTVNTGAADGADMVGMVANGPDGAVARFDDFAITPAAP